MKILTDYEDRIFLAAMNREIDICERVDEELHGDKNLIDICNSIIKKVSSAEPVSHGYWIDINQDHDTMLRECSVCHDWQTHWDSYCPKYCPKCGAKMDKEVQK